MKTRVLGRLFLILFTCAGLLMLNLEPTLAQTPTTISIEPSLVEAGLGGQISLRLDVAGGVNVNAYDIILEYDSNLLELTSWTHGNYLSNLAIVVRTQQPGYFRLVCTQLATPPVSGDGVLLNLTFTSLAPGLSNIEITGAEFADSSGNKTIPITVNGQVQIDSNPVNTSTTTATPTKTITPTLPLAPTETPTPTGTRQPTATFAFTPTTHRSTTSTRPANPITTPQARLTPTAMLQPTAVMVVTELQNSSVATPTVGVNIGLGQTSTPVSGMVTDPIVIPVRPDSSSNADQDEEQDAPNWILVIGIIVFDLIALAFILYLIWKRRRKTME